MWTWEHLERYSTSPLSAHEKKLRIIRNLFASRVFNCLIFFSCPQDYFGHVSARTVCRIYAEQIGSPSNILTIRRPGVTKRVKRTLQRA
jgi:hypothetical protein